VGAQGDIELSQLGHTVVGHLQGQWGGVFRGGGGRGRWAQEKGEGDPSRGKEWLQSCVLVTERME